MHNLDAASEKVLQVLIIECDPSFIIWRNYHIF